MAKILHNEEFDDMEGEAMRKPQQVAYNRTLPYAEFLESLYWRYVRELVYRNCRNRYHCTSCYRRDLPVDIHHRTYIHYGDELNHLEDLTLLCRSCHERLHEAWKVKAGVPEKEQLPAGCVICEKSGYIIVPEMADRAATIDYCICARGKRRRQIAMEKVNEAKSQT